MRELGDCKRSQFLRQLGRLAGANVPDDFLKTIWISHLPHGIKTVFAGQPTRRQRRHFWENFSFNKRHIFFALLAYFAIVANP